MKTVKISTLWDHKYSIQIPPLLKSEFRFEINNDCDVADYWFVWGGLRKNETVNINPLNTYFIVDEAYAEKKFRENFLNQFEYAITCRNDIHHRRLIKNHDLGIWYFNKSFEEIENYSSTEKSKKMSVVCSNLTWLPGHKKRYAFVNKLMGRFKDRIDFYGKGFNYIEDKFNALAPYQYSIAIENNTVKDYFTEKIFECFLTNTVPVYYGCPNIGDYFDSRSFATIDIDNFETSVDKIEELLESKNDYSARIPFVAESKNKTLSEYHFFPAIVRILNNHSSDKDKKSRVKLKMEYRQRSWLENYLRRMVK
jgi:hypothetical protein